VRWWLALALLLALPARADMFPDADNAKLPEAQINLGIPAVGNPAVFDPLCDGRTTDPEVNAGTAHDCTAAINSAAAVTVNGATVNVQLQPGRYYLTGPISLLTGQTLTGAGRSKTFLRVRDTFSPSAQGVVVVSGNPPDKGAGVRDLTIQFNQPTTQGSRAAFQNIGSCTSVEGGTGCRYPPAVLLSGGGRNIIQNVRIERAWDGIATDSVATVNSPGGLGNSVLRLFYVEIGALNTGLWIDGPKDVSMIEGYHFWNFGIAASTALYTGVFKDGANDCMRVGNVDGWEVANSFCHGGNVHFVNTVLPGLNGAGAAQMTNFSLDSGARLIVDSLDSLSVSNFSASGLAGVTVPPKCLITMNVPTAGTPRVLMTNVYMPHTSETSVCVYGGTLLLEGARINNFVDKPSVLVDGGALILRDAGWATNGGVVRTAPVVKLVSGILALVGNTMTGPTAGGGGVAVEVAANGSHTISGSNFGGYGMSFGCGPTTAGYCWGAAPAGSYDMPDYPFAMVTTPTILGSTDFAPVNRGTAGSWWLRGNKIEFWLREEFDSNAYTTGTNFSIATTMPPSGNGLGRSCTLSRFDKVAAYTVPPFCGLVNNTGGTATQVNFGLPVPGAGQLSLTRAANMLPSVANYLFFLQGWYPVR
jgi:hypothetical protein